jgi:quinol monooxygenase YgiN
VTRFNGEVRERTASVSTVPLMARITSLPGQERIVGGMLVEYAQQVRAEPGNLVFAPNTLSEDASQFVVYEEYLDEAAFAAHLASPHNADFNRRLAPLVVGGVSTLVALRSIDAGRR